MKTGYVKALGYEPRNIGTRLDFGFGDVDNFPSEPTKACISTRILFGIAVPVRSVCLDCDLVLYEGEIDAESPDLVLAPVLYPGDIERVHDSQFKGAVFCVKPVAPETAISRFRFFQRSNAKNKPAPLAIGEDRRTPAFLGTEVTNEPFFRTKYLPAPLARHVFCECRSACTTANGIPVSDCRAYLKILFANRARLPNHFHALRFKVTRFGAETHRSLTIVSERLTAYLARYSGFYNSGFMVAFAGAESGIGRDPFWAGERFPAPGTGIVERHKHHLVMSIPCENHERKTIRYREEETT